MFFTFIINNKFLETSNISLIKIHYYLSRTMYVFTILNIVKWQHLYLKHIIHSLTFYDLAMCIQFGSYYSLIVTYCSSWPSACGANGQHTTSVKSHAFHKLQKKSNPANSVTSDMWAVSKHRRIDIYETTSIVYSISLYIHFERDNDACNAISTVSNCFKITSNHR